jgi:MFS family permease
MTFRRGRTSAMRDANPIRSSRSFRRLWIARTVSHVGDGVALVALVLLVQRGGGTGTSVGTLLLASSVPHFLGPLAGVVADRVDQRRLMIACDVGNALVFAAVAAVELPFGLLLALVTVSATLDTLFAPAGRSAVPALVEERGLVRANAWMSTSLNLQVALGGLLGGALVAAWGPRGALAVNALSFLLSAGLLLGLPPLRAPRTDGSFVSVGVEGLRHAWRVRVVRAFVITLFLGVAFAAVDNVALVFLVTETLGGGPVAFGAVSAAYGIGMIAVSVGLSARHVSIPMGTLLVVAWIASGLGTVATGLAPAIAVAAVGQWAAGAGNGLENIAADTLIQRVVPREMLGRIFGIVATAAMAGSSVAYAAGGFLLDVTSPRAVFLIGGTGTLAVSAFLWIAIRRGLSDAATAPTS